MLVRSQTHIEITQELHLAAPSSRGFNGPLFSVSIYVAVPVGCHWAKGVLDAAGSEGFQECHWEGRPGEGEEKHGKALGSSR